MIQPTNQPTMKEDEKNIRKDDDDDQKDMVRAAQLLPQDIVEEILVRLPVKSLVRFKAVSKTWYAFISDPQFAISQLDFAAAAANNNNNRRDDHDDDFNLNLYRPDRDGILIFETDPISSISIGIGGSKNKDVDFTTDDADADADDRLLEFTVKKQPLFPFKKDDPESAASFDPVHWLGSCDGLLLVAVEASDAIFLWNPSTGETKQISSISEFTSLSLYLDGDQISGLGCDDDYNYNYKAIIAFRTNVNSPPCAPEQIAVYVYNAKSGASSFKHYHDFPYRFYSCAGGVTVNGTPHWMVSRVIKTGGRTSPLNKAIICFDMAEESFKEVPHPDSFTAFSHFRVTVLGGSLCVIHASAHASLNGVDVWAMKEYGVKESWTKLFFVPAPNTCLNLLGFINKGEVLIRAGKKIMIRDLQTCKDDHLYSSQCHGFYTVTYEESLVSPNRLGGIVRGGHKRRRLN